MRMQAFGYFHNQYGKQRGTTVMHRMRTWYNQQAKLAVREGRSADARRYTDMANGMTINITAGKGV